MVTNFHHWHVRGHLAEHGNLTEFVPPAINRLETPSDNQLDYCPSVLSPTSENEKGPVDLL